MTENWSLTDARDAYRELDDAVNWLLGFSVVRWMQTRDTQYQHKADAIGRSLGILGEYIEQQEALEP